MPVKTDEELKQLAIDVLAGQVFTDRSIKQGDEHLARSIFMVLMFMGPKHGAFLKEHCAMVYEYMEEAGPRGVNGYPMFMSFKWLTREQYPKFVAYYEALMKAQEAVKL